MVTERPDPGAEAGPPGPGALRAALPALLVLLVAVGLSGVVKAPGWAGPLIHEAIFVGAGLEVLAAACLLVLRRRDRTAGPEPVLAARLRTVLRWLLTAAVIAIPLTLLLDVHLHFNYRPHRPLPKLSPAPTVTPHTPPPAAGGGSGLSWVLWLLVALVAVAAVVVCVLLLARRKPPAVAPPDASAEAPAEAELRTAVASGTAALLRLDDARAAIIACYAAMEASLARAGAVRGIAGTPDELLAQAAAAGLAAGAPARRLTALFYEARFSSHPLPARLRDEAEQALTDIAARLGPAPAMGPPR